MQLINYTEHIFHLMKIFNRLLYVRNVVNSKLSKSTIRIIKNNKIFLMKTIHLFVEEFKKQTVKPNKYFYRIDPN